MSAIITAITSAFSKVTALILKGLSVVGGVVGGWFVSLGSKLLSFEWVQKVVNCCSKVVSYLKKTIFNAKVVKLIKFLLSVALFALTIVQIVFIVKAIVSSPEGLALDGVANIVVFALNVAALVVVVAYLLVYVLGLFKKRINWGFVGAMFGAYVITLMSNDVVGSLVYRDIAASYGKLKIAFIVVFAIATVISLLDSTQHTSFWAFVLSALGALFVYLLYKSVNIVEMVSYTMGVESTFGSGMMGFVGYFNYISEYFAGTLNTNFYIPTVQVLAQSASLSATSGKFVASIAIVFNGFVMVVSQLAPYLLLTAFGGFAMSMINNKPTQILYLSKTLKALKYLFGCLLCSVVVGGILTAFFNSDSLALNINVGKVVLSLVAVIGLAILCALSRKLIVNNCAKRMGIKNN